MNRAMKPPTLPIRVGKCNRRRGPFAFVLLAHLLLFPFLGTATIQAQVTWSPSFATDGDTLALTFDATGGNKGLLGFTGDVYLYTGVITSNSTKDTDWKYVRPAGSNGWSSFPTELKATPAGENRWTFTYGTSVRRFYGVPEGEEIQKIAVLFRGVRNGAVAAVGRAEGDKDILIPLNQSGLRVTFLTPTTPFVLQKQAEPYTVLATGASSTGGEVTLTLYQNGELVSTTQDDTLSHTVTPEQGSTLEFTLIGVEEASSGGATSTPSDTARFTLITFGEPERQARPSGVQDGITPNSDGSVTLSLFAPQKDFVHVIGSFNDWTPRHAFTMRKDSLNPDSTWYWITLDASLGLSDAPTPFQYLVDGSLRIADPYTQLVLNPGDDTFIPAQTFPDRPLYPEGRTTFQVGVLNPPHQEYLWRTDSDEYRRPAEEELVIYELLLRDFLQAHDFSTLVDTLGYLERLGVNAIQLMPINEFEGNLSWGYNPSFYFAVDKYYGPAKDLKRFVDEAHSRGIAVILDMVLNHSFGQSPMVRLYSQGAYGPPTAQNPWFNPVAKHEFNVGYDMNHESAATQYFVDRVTRFWMEEFRIDGFRFDLSKGFTQKNTLGSVSAWGQYDASRVRLLKRMADRMWQVDSTAYVILEHFAENREEKELADYGMLLWRNINHAYNQATMGYTDGSDFSGVYHGASGWDVPHAIGYMESHDEQWLMFKNLKYGNAADGYSVRTLSTALERQKMAGAFFFLWPGPKMLWQFGELGYGGGSRECLKPGGSSNGDCLASDPGRTDSKPIRWEYRQDSTRYSLFQTWSALIALRKAHPAFTSGETSASWSLGGTVKHLILDHPSLKATVIGNFGVVAENKLVYLPTQGPWYDYFTGQMVVSATLSTLSRKFEPGEFLVLTTQPFDLPDGMVTSIAGDTDGGASNGTEGQGRDAESGLPTQFRLHSPYPNPFNPSTTLRIDIPGAGRVQLEIVDITGRVVQTLLSQAQLPAGRHSVRVDASGLTSGLYFARLVTPSGLQITPLTLIK